MRIQISRKLFHLCSSLILPFLLGGCSAFLGEVPVASPQLTVTEAERVGSAVEVKLLQMLGGPYHDSDLAKALDGAVPVTSFHIAVADQSLAALYPLPGKRVILTRGLLAGLENSVQLQSLLAKAVELSNAVYQDRVARDVVVSIEELLSTPDTVYNPDSAAIRLARRIKEDPCVKECLVAAPPARGKEVDTASHTLPEPIRQLSLSLPGYELLAEAGRFEKDGKQSPAIASYLKAAAIAPEEPGILGPLGLAYLRAGQLQEARIHLQKAVKLQPDYYKTQMGLGYLYLQQGKHLLANQFLASSVGLLPVEENLFLLAEAREKSADIEGAISLYRLVAETGRLSKLGRTSSARLAELTGEK